MWVLDEHLVQYGATALIGMSADHEPSVLRFFRERMIVLVVDDPANIVSKAKKRILDGGHAWPACRGVSDSECLDAVTRVLENAKRMYEFLRQKELNVVRVHAQDSASANIGKIEAAIRSCC